jgi:propanol-preferring alcohol dehydrogenase
MPKYMKAAVIKEFGKPLEIRKDVPVPEPGVGELLVRIKASGVCHTDVEVMMGAWAPIVEAVKAAGVTIPGHEGVGVVEEVGPGVWMRKEGDRVGVPMLSDWCGACEYCLRGEVYWCPNAKYAAFSRNGTFAQYALINQKAAPIVPKEIKDEEAGPLMCAGITVYNGVRKIPTLLHVPANKPIAVVGAAGGLGHYAVQIAKAFGYKVVGIDIGPERLKFVEKLGADWAVDAKDAVKFVKEKIGGVYASIVTATKIAAYDTAMKVLKPGGAVIVIGCPPSAEGAIQAVPVDIVLLNIKLIPSMIGATPDFDELFNLCVEGKVKTHLSRVGKLEDINTIMKELEEYKYTGRASVKID